MTRRDQYGCPENNTHPIGGRRPSNTELEYGNDDPRFDEDGNRLNDSHNNPDGEVD